MRILIASAGSHGDILPLIALAKKFVDNGHEVIFYANPFFKPYLANTSIQFTAIESIESYKTLFQKVNYAKPEEAFRLVTRELMRLCPLYYQAMKADVIHGQTIALSNSLLFAPRLLREAAAVPCVTVHLSPSVFRSNLNPPRLLPNWITAKSSSIAKKITWWIQDNLFFKRDFARPLNHLRTKLGLPQVATPFNTWLHQADCVLALFPNWFAEPQADWAQNIILTGFPLYDSPETTMHTLSPALLEFINAGSPPIVLSAGTATANAHDFFKISIAACQKAGQRAILLSHFSEQIPSVLPANILHVDYAPFSVLLPHCAAFVHHGGIGTTSQALRAGVPQLIRPVAYDQFDNSLRSVNLGVAHELLAKHYTIDNVANSLNKLVNNEQLRQRCQQIAKNFISHDSLQFAYEAIMNKLT